MRSRIRKIFIGFIGASIGIILVFASSSSMGAEEAVKIGHLDPYSGPYAVFGGEQEQGLKLYFDQINWRVAGREIKLISEDTEAKPSEALQKARKLVEKDQVSLLVGITSSAVSTVIRDYADQVKVPLIVSTAAGNDIISCQKRSKYLFRSNYSYIADEYPLADYVVNIEGKKNIIIGAPDYQAQINWYMLGRAFEKAGGKVVQKFSFPFGTIDFLPTFMNLKVSQADAVWVFCAGADAVRFVTQWAKTGMNKRIALYGSSHLVSSTVLSEQKDAALGIVCVGHWFPEINNPLNIEFVNQYKLKHGKEPTYLVEHGYTTAKLIAEALKATKGDTKDSEKFLKAIQDAQFDSPRGPFRFEKENNTVINTVYVAKVIKKGDAYGYAILKTIPDVKFSTFVPILFPGYEYREK